MRIETGFHRDRCQMSTSLFNMFMDAMMRKVNEGLGDGVIIGQERVLDQDFADDVALLADSWLVLMKMILTMEEASQTFDTNISANKSDILYH